MPVLKLALLAGAGACLYVAWASWSAGYPVELAITRGVGAFVAMAVLGFLGELTIARARPQEAAERSVGRVRTDVDHEESAA
jgi:hypothetical protein